jgi:hypothetical protein
MVLERARGVGGRCATRRLEGQPFDHGVAFLHGRDPGFLAALEEVPGRVLPGWPSLVKGGGRPCQPEAFAPGERRLALAEGVNAFPRHLAAGLEVRRETAVEALEPGPGTVTLRLAGGGAIEARTAVLALAAEQAARLLATVPPPAPEIAAARAVLDLAPSLPCLALSALYPPGAPAPPFHVLYPEGSAVLQLVAHDSAKRPAPAGTGLVLQAHPGWSRRHLDDPAWPQALLGEAARVLGPWAATPAATHAHCWRHARHDRSAELAAPMLPALPGGARLGLCGDLFAPGGGVEAAWRSGQAMAGRILAGEG